MKKMFFVLIFVLLLALCACQEVPDPSGGPSSSGQQLASQPSSSSKPIPTFQRPTQTKPVPPTSVPEPTLPQNCDEGHTFPNEAPNCAVCGIEYYSATLFFNLSEDGTYYYVWSFGNCNRTTVIVPETYNGLPVERIHSLVTVNDIFGPHYEQYVTHVVLPDTIKSIGAGAFSAYSSLVSINIPKGVTRIEDRTFLGCSSLVSLDLPDGVTYIGENAFSHCAKLKDLQIPEGVTEIGEAAFMKCLALEELRIPEAVTEIPSKLVSECISLKTIHYGKNVTKIGDAAFSGCAGLQSFVIGENVTTIGQGAFNKCIGLRSIVIPNAVTEIGRRAFTDCGNLKSIVIGTGVKQFGLDAFLGCNNLKTVFYMGAKAEWEQILMEIQVPSEGTLGGSKIVSTPNPQFDNIAVCFYSETTPTDSGNYWHYVDGIPTPWKSEE